MNTYTKIAITVLAGTMLSTTAYAEQGKLDTVFKSIMEMSPKAIMQKIQDSGITEKRSLTPQVLEVNGQGQVRLRGVVTAVATSSFSVKTWGGVWTILPGVTPEIISKDKSLSTFAVGDYVGVQGSIVPEATLTVQGNVIRNRSWNGEKKDEKMMKKEDRMSSTSTDRGILKSFEDSKPGIVNSFDEIIKKMRGGREVTPPPIFSTSTKNEQIPDYIEVNSQNTFSPKGGR